MARLFEYQGKQLLKKAKVPIPQGEVATTPQEARKIAETIGITSLGGRTRKSRGD
jgi:succinyl-CoA synthetase beta subunit